MPRPPAKHPSPPERHRRRRRLGPLFCPTWPVTARGRSRSPRAQLQGPHTAVHWGLATNGPGEDSIALQGSPSPARLNVAKRHVVTDEEPALVARWHGRCPAHDADRTRGGGRREYRTSVIGRRVPRTGTHQPQLHQHDRPPLVLWTVIDLYKGGGSRARWWNLRLGQSVVKVPGQCRPGTGPRPGSVR